MRSGRDARAARTGVTCDVPSRRVTYTRSHSRRVCGLTLLCDGEGRVTLEAAWQGSPWMSQSLGGDEAGQRVFALDLDLAVRQPQPEIRM